MPRTTVAAKKEPEDIFAGIETPAAPIKPSASAMPVARRVFPWKLILIVLIVLVVFGGIGFAVWTFVLKPSTTEVPAPPPVSAPTAAPAQTIEQPPPAAQPVETAPTPVTTTPPGTTIPTPITTPTVPPVVGEGIDTDADGLTDMEEPFYGADPAKSDTDGDGFSDGSEVRNLFSPAAKNASLSSAPFMSTLTWNNWSFLAPKPWSIVADPATPDQAYVATGSATRFTLLRKANPTRETIDAWLAQNSIVASKIVKTKSGIEGRQSEDGLTTYLPAGDSVLQITYDLNGDPAYEFRTSYAMVVNSLGIK